MCVREGVGYPFVVKDGCVVFGGWGGGQFVLGVEGGDYDYEAVCFSWLMMCAL